jgi:hypothetical protein
VESRRRRKGRMAHGDDDHDSDNDMSLDFMLHKSRETQDHAPCCHFGASSVYLWVINVTFCCCCCVCVCGCCCRLCFKQKGVSRGSRNKEEEIGCATHVQSMYVQTLHYFAHSVHMRKR